MSFVPRTDPWGTPEVTDNSSELLPSRTTVWILPTRNDWIHLRVLPSIPCIFSLQRSFGWLTLSKALLKSNSIRSVWYLSWDYGPGLPTNWIEFRTISFHEKYAGDHTGYCVCQNVWLDWKQYVPLSCRGYMLRKLGRNWLGPICHPSYREDISVLFSSQLELCLHPKIF